MFRTLLGTALVLVASLTTANAMDPLKNSPTYGIFKPEAGSLGETPAHPLAPAQKLVAMQNPNTFTVLVVAH